MFSLEIKRDPNRPPSEYGLETFVRQPTQVYTGGVVDVITILMMIALRHCLLLSGVGRSPRINKGYRRKLIYRSLEKKATRCSVSLAGHE